MIIETSGDRAKKIVAVIEDDDDTRQMLCMLFVREGYVALPFADAAGALHVMRGMRAPDLILLDLRMPGMDGWAFRLEQRKELALAKVPVVVLTGDPSPQARVIDVDAFVAKPPKIDELLATVERLLSGREGDADRIRRIALGRDASLGAIAAGMAQELDHPLADVLTNLHVLRDDLGRLEQSSVEPGRAVLMKELDAMLRGALEAAARVAQLVSALKTVSSADGVPLPFDVNTVLEATVNVAAGAVPARARLIRALGAVPMVRGDVGRFGRALLQLLMNASDAIPDSVRDGQIRVATRTGPGGEAIVAVSDNGRGLCPEQRARLFHPLAEASPASVSLGLTACLGTVNAMGGTLRLDSDVGIGTTVTIVLPPASLP